jgi:hypothetical protein
LRTVAVNTRPGRTVSSFVPVNVSASTAVGAPGTFAKLRSREAREGCSPPELPRDDFREYLISRQGRQPRERRCFCDLLK